MKPSRWVVPAAILAIAAICVSSGFLNGSASGSPRKASASSRERGADSAKEESQIREVITAQEAAWNRGDIDSFMAYYWRSDETLFVGASGVVRGWRAVLDRYRRSYPDRKAMGQLTFSNVEVHLWCADAGFVVGQFQLEREHDRPAGVFTLDFRRFADGWRIVADHTTAFPAARPAESR
ncbi:MAG TPA: AtzH-like domain-containing protein [Candidatus Acidoferrum sp.]|nr:AtzH-like domain-containing protein [Candidatus Acidoferrum sp.]